MCINDRVSEVGPTSVIAASPQGLAAAYDAVETPTRSGAAGDAFRVLNTSAAALLKSVAPPADRVLRLLWTSSPPDCCTFWGSGRLVLRRADEKTVIVASGVAHRRALSVDMLLMKLTALFRQKSICFRSLLVSHL